MLTFSCSDPRKWSEALASYERSLQSLDRPKLTALDKWYREELPCLLQDREPPYLSQPELKKLMEWKLARGKWRPGLMKFVSGLSERDVKDASQKAFAALPNLKQAISHLSVLKGVGPATASAVLAVYEPNVAPFMSDEFFGELGRKLAILKQLAVHTIQAMIAALGNAKDYTLKQYLFLAEKLQNKAKELTRHRTDTLEEGSVVDWSPSDVERAIWASSIEAKDSSFIGKTESSAGKLNSKTKKRLRNGKAKEA